MLLVFLVLLCKYKQRPDQQGKLKTNWDFVSETVYDKIRPRQKQPPRIYGLPKIHHPDIYLHLWLILSAYQADILSLNW